MPSYAEGRRWVVQFFVGQEYVEGVEVEDTLDWYAVAMAGERAMSESPNGSCQATLMADEDTEVLTVYPKGRDPERRAWAMAGAITKLKAALEKDEAEWGLAGN